MPETPLRGLELLRAAVNQILEHPETWHQEKWHCGTRHCIGGWCQVLAGRPESGDVMADLVGLVGLSSSEACWLCQPFRSLNEIYIFARKKLGLTLTPL